MGGSTSSDRRNSNIKTQEEAKIELETQKEELIENELDEKCTAYFFNREPKGKENLNKSLRKNKNKM